MAWFAPLLRFHIDLVTDIELKIGEATFIIGSTNRFLGGEGKGCPMKGRFGWPF
jgi:hypothetical protein